MSSNTQRIRELNDAFRTNLSGGRVMMTAGTDALDSDVKAMIIREVATFGDFNADNDPHGEHDFGAIEVAGLNVFWKIDAYDPDLRFGGPRQPRCHDTRHDHHAGGRVLKSLRWPSRIGSATGATLDATKQAVDAVARTQGELRFVHLKYHLLMAAALTPAQSRRYAELRGYVKQ